jgi:hypothetical protein
MTHQHVINTCHINTHLASATASFVHGKKNFKIMYLTYMISILNFIFNIVFYPTRWIKLDHTYICFKEFLNQLNLLHKNRMSIYPCLMTKKPPQKLKISGRNFLQIWMSYGFTIDKKQFIGYTNYSFLNSTFHPLFI